MDAPQTETESRLERLVTRFVESVQPKPSRIRKSVARLRIRKPDVTTQALAEYWAERVCRKYAAEGAATALPAVLPGLGTSVQIALEGSTVAADLTYMLHCMADIVMGVGHIFGKEIERPFNEEFVRVLGLWCGALSLGKETALRISSKVVTSQVKRVPEELLKRVPQRVGRDLLTRFGFRRGSVTLGRLVPFGIGALVGGGFNYATMRGFKNTAIAYYSSVNGPT